MVIFMKNKKGFTLIELLAVVTILGILTAIAVIGYSRYLAQSKDKSFKILEDSFVTATKDLVADCNTYNKNCNIIDEATDNKISLISLIDSGYIDKLKNPYDTSQFCNFVDSYVTIQDNGYVNNNLDIKYSVHLVCGDHTSK